MMVPFRAVYANADLYLLDDPLSAVDVEVAKSIMADCIRGLLKSKAIILVTHQVQYLDEATEILLFQNGRVVSRGRFPDVIGSLDSEVDVVDNLELDPQIDTRQIQRVRNPTKTKGGYGTFVELKSTLDQAEEETTGGVKFGLHWKFWSATGVAPAIFLLLLFILVQVFSSGSDYWLRNV